MVVTLVLGIAFGGVRIITKRLFPGKVFDRKEQIEVLQLGLVGEADRSVGYVLAGRALTVLK